MKLFTHIITVLILLFFISPVIGQETVEQKKEKADKLFEEEEYVLAFPLYSHLVGLSPFDPELNFKYGTCSLYNGEADRAKALPFLTAAIQSPSIDPRAYYFRAKAYHLDYQFDQAKKNYEIYQSKRQKKDNRYDVEREIEMCASGKKLLSTFTDIIVSDKKEVEESKFFRLYDDMNQIGGNILVSEKFQTKLDKKKGHVPVIHFQDNAQEVYYSSYGESDENGLDIYMKKRLPNGEFGSPIKVPGLVNTPYDDNYPYMHPNGKFLYFSSRGHNSMGGYDVFLARRNSDSEAFDRIENVDFAISSPDDDLFYVVDAEFKNAYFASARQSEGGMLHVYRVKVVRIPVQEVIIMGDFISQINPENKEMNVSIVSNETDAVIGTMRSNPNGDYSFIYPKGGSYTMNIEIKGVDGVSTATFDVPFMDEFRPLKQQVVHKIENGEEVVKVINLFGETADGAEELIADFLNQKAKLDVNEGQYDVNQMELQALAGKRNELLADLGFKELRPQEIQIKLEDLAEAETDKTEEGKVIIDSFNSRIVDAGEEIDELKTRLADAIADANATNDPEEKYDKLLEAKEIAEDLEEAIDKVNGYTELKSEVAAQSSGTNSGDNKIADIKREFDALLAAGDEEAALNFVASKKDDIEGAQNSGSDGLIADLVDEGIDLRAKQEKLLTENRGYDANIEARKAELNIVLSKIPGSKGKTRTALEKERDELQDKIDMFEKEVDINQDEITRIGSRTAFIDENIEILESIGSQTPSSVSAADVDAAVATARNTNPEKDINSIDTQLADLREKNPNLGQGATDVAVTRESVEDDLFEDYEKKQEEIRNNPDLSEQEKLEALQNNDEKIKADAEEQLAEVQQQLGSNPEDENLLTKLAVLNDIIFDTDEAIKDREKEIAQLEDGSEPAITAERMITTLNPGYTDRTEAINKNPNLTELAKLEALQDQDSALKTSAEDRKATVEAELGTDPTNPNLQAQVDVLNFIIQSTDEALKDRKLRIENIEAGVPDVAVSKEDVIKDLAPNYASDVQDVNDNPNLSEVEKLKAVQVLDSELLDTAKERLNEIETQLATDPDNPDLLGEADLLNGIVDEANDRIAERTQTINALGDTSSIVDIEQIQSDIIADVKSDYDDRINDIENSPKSEGEKLQDRWELEREILDKLEERKADTGAKLNDSPDDGVLRGTMSAINTLITDQARTLDATRNAALQAVLGTERYTQTIAKVDRKFTVDIGDLYSEAEPPLDKIADREEQLQGRLEEEIEKKKNALEKKYSVDVDLDLMILERELAESKKRADAARNGGTAIASNPSDEFIEDMREKFINGQEVQVNSATLSPEQLRDQENMLRDYTIDLESERGRVERELESDPTNTNLVDQLQWIDNEQTQVENALEDVTGRISDGAVEAVVRTPATDPTLNALDARAVEIEEQLNDPALSDFEKKELTDQLADVNEERTVRENEITEEQLVQAQVKQDDLNNALQQLGGQDSQSEAVRTAIETSEKERAAIERIIVKADKADSEEERKFLLDEAVQRQENLNDMLLTVRQNEEIAEIEKTEGITLLSRPELESRRAKFIIQIGDLEQQIDRIDGAIEAAKQKDKPGLIQERNAIESQRHLLVKQLESIEARLTSMEEEEPMDMISSAATNVEVSYNEERRIAATDDYKKYIPEGEKLLQIENEIRILQEKIDQERKELVDILGEPASVARDEETKIHSYRIKGMEDEIRALREQYERQNEVAYALLPDNKEDAMKIQNLLARSVAPIATATTALALLQMPLDGLAIEPDRASVYSDANPIPVGVEGPSGLTYRVQIGAFGRPIPQDLFKEFNPVSGEAIGNTGITRYMAGYFNSGDAVVNAREAIRALGYADAFVVAYCDGERITFGEARRLEAEGTCVPKGTNEIMIEVAQNTAEKLGIPIANELTAVPEYSYNQAPGAADADPIELKQGLFFTVQLGVYNRPVGDERLKNLPEILTVRLPNGQIRYSTGMFDSWQEAEPRKADARQRGIGDAYTVAYYKGERLSVGQALRILAQNGPGILQSNIEKVNPPVVVDVPADVVRMDTVSTNVIEVPVETVEKNIIRVQIVTKATFNEFPRDVLNRYNAEGNFYYDVKDGRVKSPVVDDPSKLPRVFKFQEDIDTVYLNDEQLDIQLEKKKVLVLISSDQIPGDLSDWLLRLNYSKKFVRTDEFIQLQIDGIEPNDIEKVLYDIRAVGLVPTVVNSLEEI